MSLGEPEVSGWGGGVMQGGSAGRWVAIVQHEEEGCTRILPLTLHAHTSYLPSYLPTYLPTYCLPYFLLTYLLSYYPTCILPPYLLVYLATYLPNTYISSTY